MIPYGRQDLVQSDIDAVVSVLESDFLTQGPVVPLFERKVSGYCGVKHAVAVSNATAALHIACLALGLKPGGLVWTVPNTFVASANCALYCGARVDFVDIDPDTLNMSVAALEVKLELAQAGGNLPDIVIPVHFAGMPCDMRAIGALAKRYGFAVIEDASHAIGAEFDGVKVGACEHSDVTVFSFHPVKILTTGEGGMALTNSAEIFHRMQLLRSHGISRDINDVELEAAGGWYYKQIDLGFNYRLTDIQAALGLSQMDRLSLFLDRRRRLAERYQEGFADWPLKVQAITDGAISSNHLFVIRVSVNRKEVYDALRASGVGVNVHYIPVHTQPYYRQLGFKVGMYPESERYYSEAISLPIYSTLSDEQQDFVVESLRLAIDASLS